LPLILIYLTAVLFVTMLARRTSAQCVDHPDKKSGLKFSNESRFELTFFVDDDEKGVVVSSKAISDEISVEPGGTLRARAIVRGESFWVWIVNEVPRGQDCIWSVEDPLQGANVEIAKK
jgi:hypothetical protein